MSNFSIQRDDDLGLTRLIDGRGVGIAVLDLGAELVSWRATFDDAVVGLLHRDGDIALPPTGWRNHATVLFPFVGRLAGGARPSRDGRVVTMTSNHGFARRSTFTLVETLATNDGGLLRYRLSPNEMTRAEYPHDFIFEMTYELAGGVLIVRQTVINPSTTETLPASFGWHPGFAIDRENFDLTLPSGTYGRLLTRDDGLLTRERVDVDYRGPFMPTDTALAGTVILDVPAGQRVVALRDHTAGREVRMAFPDHPQLGLWAAPGEPFVCIEPWQGTDDRFDEAYFDDKYGLIQLPPGQTHAARVVVSCCSLA